MRRALAEGGAGLNQHKSRDMAAKTAELITESRDIARYRRKIEEDWFFSKHRWLIRRLRMNLFDEYEGKLTLTHVRRMEDAISDRIIGNMKKDDFEKRLRTSLEKGGLGFNSQTGKKLALHLEKLLAQSADIGARH